MLAQMDGGGTTHETQTHRDRERERGSREKEKEAAGGEGIVTE